jgi:hypothetical protein
VQFLRNVTAGGKHTRKRRVSKLVTNGGTTAVMDVIGFPSVSLGSSTVSFMTV